MKLDVQAVEATVAKALFSDMLRSRMIEEKMLNLLRQGKISKWFSGIGQEAIAVGVSHAVQSDDFILPMHRNLGVFVSRRVPWSRLFKQWQGKADGFTKGRDRSFHFGSIEHRIIGMISHLGPQMGVACGLALAGKLRGDGTVVAVFTGEGGTSEGDFHEALNVASVWDLPVLFIVENNGYGLSTPTREQFRCERISDKAVGYGMDGVTIEGNDAIEVFTTVRARAEQMRTDHRPVLIECETFRMRGHEEASGTKYVPGELFDEWGRKDPVENLRQTLLDDGILAEDELAALRTSIADDVLAAWTEAVSMPDVAADDDRELGDVYRPHEPTIIEATGAERDLRLVDAVREGLYESMAAHDDLVIMGQDVADYGGVFKVTDGFVEAFGAERVRNTPLCESVILSATVGLSAKRFKSVVEMQFADFVSTGFTALVNNMAKLHYRWGQNVDAVVRMPTGAGVGAGPFHSQSNEAWFFHVPGLKIVYPSTPADAKGLMMTAVDDPNPVMFFEHKLLYRSETGPVPDGPYTVPIGSARRVRTGTDISIITYGLAVRWATELADEHPDTSFDIVDLRSLVPLDEQAVLASVRRTGKVIVLHEDTLSGGIGAEVAARIADAAFEHLDGPVKRVASLDTPVPFAAGLEASFLPRERFADTVRDLLAY